MIAFAGLPTGVCRLEWLLAVIPSKVSLREYYDMGLWNSTNGDVCRRPPSGANNGTPISQLNDSIIVEYKMFFFLKATIVCIYLLVHKLQGSRVAQV